MVFKALKVLLIVTADTKASLMSNTNENLKRIHNWMGENELELMPKKQKPSLSRVRGKEKA